MVTCIAITFADLKLMDRSKQEGKAEVSEKYALSTMPLLRRVCTLIYLAWLFIEGPISALQQFTKSRSPALVAYGVEHSIMYFIIAGLLLVLLHTYIGRPLPRHVFRATLLIHQITVAALSFWRYICSKTNDQAGTGFRLILLCFCALGEIEGFVIAMVHCFTSSKFDER
jgi:hypothetical protein